MQAAEATLTPGITLGRQTTRQQQTHPAHSQGGHTIARWQLAELLLPLLF
jgi:hypothetical protein